MLYKLLQTKQPDEIRFFSYSTTSILKQFFLHNHKGYSGTFAVTDLEKRLLDYTKHPILDAAYNFFLLLQTSSGYRQDNQFLGI